MSTTHLIQFFFHGASVGEPVPTVSGADGGLGNVDWLRNNDPTRKRRRKRLPTEAEFAHEQDRLARQAKRLAETAIPMDRVPDGEVIGDEIDDDDLLLKAAVLRIFH